MTAIDLLDPSAKVTAPPEGSVNVAVGEPVSGPGGQWVPSVTRTTAGRFYPAVFEVGPGHRQVCATEQDLPNARQALTRAIELASFAAA